VKRYRSRIDFLPVVFNVAVIFMVDTAAMLVSMEAVTRYYPYAVFATFIVIVAVPAALLLLLIPVRYHLAPDQLVLRSGVLRWRIPVADILRARLVRNVWPAPALSMMRIRIEYQHGQKVGVAHLSPPDRRGFLTDLAACDPGMRLEEDTVLRQSGKVILMDARQP